MTSYATKPMERPKIGDTRVYIREYNNKFSVQVDVFKENTLRGDAYWVTKEFKTYTKEKDALKFASRFQ
jgi:hypothetical protein